ncbi:MAG: O-antigen ligase family protein [Alphaproteobacteria bacterium]|nr:O-antigen ligase family protein [Alphaproteobacteria bacterium]
MSVPNNEPANVAEKGEPAVLFAVAFAFLPVAVLAPGQMWIVAVAGALLLVLLRALSGTWPIPLRSRLGLLFAALILWGAASWLWSVAPARTLYTGSRLILLAACLLVLLDAARNLDPAGQRRFNFWLVGGTVVGLVLLALFILTNGAFAAWIGLTIRESHELERFNRTAGVLAIFVWPVALVIAQLFGRYVAAVTLLLATLALFALAPSTPLFAFLAGLVAFGLAWVSATWAKRLLIAGFAISVAIVPFLDTIVPLANTFLIENVDGPNSEVHRFLIWQFAAERILDQPLFGWGLDTARAVPGGDAQLFMFQFGDNPTMGQAMPLHPHNALMQIWLELGVVGLAIAAALFALIVVSIPERRGNRAMPAAALATLASAFAIAQLSFGIWQGWWMATLGIVAILVTAIVVPGTRATAPADRDGA